MILAFSGSSFVHFKICSNQSMFHLFAFYLPSWNKYTVTECVLSFLIFSQQQKNSFYLYVWNTCVFCIIWHKYYNQQTPVYRLSWFKLAVLSHQVLKRSQPKTIIQLTTNNKQMKTTIFLATNSLYIRWYLKITSPHSCWTMAPCW